MSKQFHQAKGPIPEQSPASYRSETTKESQRSSRAPHSPRQELMFVASLADDDGVAQGTRSLTSAGARPPQTTLYYVHVRRDLVEAGAPLEIIIDDINRIVRERGAIVLSSGQILRVPLESNWDLDTHFDDYSSSPDEHKYREWSSLQREYFGSLWSVTEPFQYSEAPSVYDQYAINIRIPTPYLTEGERILALVDAKREGMHFYCPCRNLSTVLRHRVGLSLLSVVL